MITSTYKKKELWNRVDCQRSEKRPQTHKRFKERYILSCFLQLKSVLLTSTNIRLKSVLLTSTVIRQCLISSYGSRHTWTSPWDSVLCPMRTAHSGSLSDTRLCPMVTSMSVCRKTVPRSGSGPLHLHARTYHRSRDRLTYRISVCLSVCLSHSLSFNHKLSIDFSSSFGQS